MLIVCPGRPPVMFIVWKVGTKLVVKKLPLDAFIIAIHPLSWKDGFDTITGDDKLPDTVILPSTSNLPSTSMLVNSVLPPLDIGTPKLVN